ncbi:MULTISPECIES: MFS transporter [unclassified Streptomyces]|uniref:MFS transporter n=1 Tax=unclassified Streptomyces TaxID=2593676 RepID=UPI0016603367|nr:MULTISPECIES: MFS transporter [unclassified Streptomyces]MBD0711693.1 hypothetical protein [Streptomyces sp. CBMA291]MBD0713896.1 hypothetical protein [Streptomyces sp. CBMA370]
MTGKQKTVLIVLSGAQFLFAVDFSLLTVALPETGSDLGFGIGSLQWISTAFALTAAGLMLLFGRIGDLIGRKKLFLVGMALLTVSSLLGGLADSPELMITARVLQGLATAIVTPSGMALITTSFPEGPLRTKALGLNGALLSLGFAGGAVLGGVLTDLLSWRWDFFINVPVGIALFAGGVLVIGNAVAEDRPKLDVPGSITVTAGLLAFVYGITSAEREGWDSARTWATLLVAAVLFATFVGGFGHVLAIVSYTVVSTSGIEDREQGLATGLAAMTRRIGFTLGIPVMSAVAASRYGDPDGGVASAAGVLDGTTFGILVDGLLVLAGALVISLLLRRARPAASAGATAADDAVGPSLAAVP